MNPQLDAETCFPADPGPLVCTDAAIRAIDVANRRVTHVISTGRLDRNNRIVDPAGWKLANFRKNPRVLADHDYSIDRIIGRAVDTKIDGDALVSTTEFDDEGVGAVAFRLVQNGLASAWSVGWQRLEAHRIGEKDGCAACESVVKKVEWGVHYTKQELLEYSLVAIPANPDAVMGLERAGLVAHEDAAAWLDAFAERPAVITDPQVISRSPAFTEALRRLTRDLQREATARRLAREIREIRY